MLGACDDAWPVLGVKEDIPDESPWDVLACSAQSCASNPAASSISSSCSHAAARGGEGGLWADGLSCSPTSSTAGRDGVGVARGGRGRGGGEVKTWPACTSRGREAEPGASTAEPWLSEPR